MCAAPLLGLSRGTKRREEEGEWLELGIPSGQLIHVFSFGSQLVISSCWICNAWYVTTVRYRDYNEARQEFSIPSVTDKRGGGENGRPVVFRRLVLTPFSRWERIYEERVILKSNVVNAWLKSKCGGIIPTVESVLGGGGLLRWDDFSRFDGRCCPRLAIPICSLFTYVCLYSSRQDVHCHYQTDIASVVDLNFLKSKEYFANVPFYKNKCLAVTFLPSGRL